jgi:hypothetical protein
MLRYYLISAGLVLFLGIVAGAFHRGVGPELRIASVQSTSSPSPPRSQGASRRTPSPVTGDAPWAMSAVPECFRQRREVQGPTEFVRARIPTGARVVPPGTTIASGDCELVVGEGSLELRRGSESLRVPPTATLYALSGGDIALLRRDRTGTVLRFYRLSAER